MRSKNYISGNKNSNKFIFITIIVSVVIITLTGILALWSFYSCARAGIVKDMGMISILKWTKVIFSTSLCPLDTYTIKFIFIYLIL